MLRRRFIARLGSTAIAPLAALPACASPSDVCDVPPSQPGGWPVASIDEDTHVDRGSLCHLADRLATSSGANIHSIVVARSGKLVFERYLQGADETFSHPAGTVTFDASRLHDMKSVSKSIASLAFGIAMDRGLIKNIDQPIFDFFPELADLRTPEKDCIRLSHVLTMSMGQRWIEATPATGDENNDEARMNRSLDAARYVLGLPVTAPAGQEFFYNTGALALLSTIVQRACGTTLDEFARITLFEPLGISDFQWRRIRGLTDAGGGLRLRPRDMAKIGQLVLQGGRWNGVQVVSKAWVDASTTMKMQHAESYSYGYLWWLGRTVIDGRKYDWIGALGRGGQSIRIVPQLDAVIVVTAGYYQDYSPAAFKLQYAVFKDVLNAIEPMR